MARAVQLHKARECDGQTAFPGTERISEAVLAKRRAAQRMRAAVVQKPADFGLFGGDEWKQRDLF